LYAQFLKSEDLCFDIGANVGRKVEVFRQLNARVIAFEPQPRCAEQLRKRFAGDSAVTIVPEGVSAAEGVMTLHLAQATEVASMSADFIQRNTRSSRFGGNVWNGSMQVRVGTMDAAIARYGKPAFVKVDVEGHEQEVLAGLSAPVPALSFEFSAETLETAIRIVGSLEKRFRMEFNYCNGKSLRLGEPAWLSAIALEMALAKLSANDPLLWGDIYARTAAGASQTKSGV